MTAIFAVLATPLAQFAEGVLLPRRFIWLDGEGIRKFSNRKTPPGAFLLLAVFSSFLVWCT